MVLTRDLARLYECKNGTKEINQAVKNNIEKFPERFSWILTKEEAENLRSKVLTSSYNKNYGGRRYAIRVFIEQGVAMLSSVLKTNRASIVSINIMRSFVAMRKYISNSLIEQKYINELILKDTKRIDLLEETFNSFKEKNNHIFFEGQIYDAYSLLIEILEQANKRIVIIDNYAGRELLDIIKNINKNIIIVSKNINMDLIKKYNTQYTNVTFINNNSFHDRFIIIDDKILYHSSSSFKDLGTKCFAINKIENELELHDILKTIDI